MDNVQSVTPSEGNRYTELDIEGVREGGVAVDFGENPPELIIDKGDGQSRSIELPDEG